MTRTTERSELARDVALKAQRLAEARRRPTDVWSTLLRVAGLGWVLALPAVLGAVGGHFVAAKLQRPFIALVGLGLGLAIGAYGVFRQVKLGLREDTEARPPDERKDA